MSHPIQSLLAKALEEFSFSAYQVVTEKSGHTHSFFGGKTSHWGEGKAISEETLFDIGSVTKAVCTTSVIARYYDRGEVKLEDRLSKYSPDLKAPLSDLTLGDCLNHCAGLIDWLPLYEDLGKQELVSWLNQNSQRIVVAKPRTVSKYSDFGFILLGLVLAAKSGSIEEAFQREVVEPLNLKGVLFNPKPASEIVATEFRRDQNRLLQGVVFDENTETLGGVSSHAGLFSSAKSLLPWAKEWLSAWQGKSRWLTEKTAKLYASKTGWVPASSWALGWDTKSPQGSSAGDKFSPESFGHLGYPGCSVWIDPRQSGVAIFFTNRVHPSRADERIRLIRPKLHDAIAEDWLKHAGS